MRDRFYFTSQIGPNRYMTPEGYLVCIGVAIARTGIQEYGPGETPVEAGPDGIVYIDRSEDQVFRKETIDSANGKSLSDDHPPDDINPRTWRKLTVGVALHPRRGEGDDSNALVADLMWTDHDAIGLVLSGKVELSCGYDCDYEQDEPGRGRQLNIIINHIALVDAGRCGSQCSIRDAKFTGDHSMCKCNTKTEDAGNLNRGKDMKRFAKVKDAIKKAFDAKSEQELEKALDMTKTAMDEEREEGLEEGEKKAKWTDDALDDRFDSIDAKQKEHDGKIATHDSAIADLQKKDGESAEEEEATEDAMEEETGTMDSRKVRDSSPLSESYQATVSLAEIIAPGLHIATFDAKAPRRKTLDAICGLRRKALAVAGATTDGAAIIAELRSGRVLTSDKLATLDCAGVRGLFLGVGAAMRAKRSTTGDKMGLVDPNKTADSQTEDRATVLARKRKEFWGQ